MHALEAEKTAITARLEGLKAGKAKKVTAEEREEVDKEWKRWRGVAARREKIAGEMWREIVEVVGDEEMRAELREAFDLDG